MSHGHFNKVTLLTFLLSLNFLSCERVSSSGMNANDKEIYATTPPPEYGESIRKEIIKVQILQRLGLTEKPRVNNSHKLSKDLALEILKRTDSSGGGGNGLSNTVHANSTQANVVEEDSNFAKTSEIISFPEKGKLLTLIEHIKIEPSRNRQNLSDMNYSFFIIAYFVVSQPASIKYFACK